LRAQQHRVECFYAQSSVGYSVSCGVATRTVLDDCRYRHSMQPPDDDHVSPLVFHPNRAPNRVLPQPTNYPPLPWCPRAPLVLVEAAESHRPPHPPPWQTLVMLLVSFHYRDVSAAPIPMGEGGV